MTNTTFSFDNRLNAAYLESMYDGDLEHVQMIFEQFAELTPAQMKEVEESFETGVPDKFRQKLHMVKAIFSFVGLTNLTASVDVMEKKCMEISSLSELEGNYKEFKSDFNTLFPVIENEIQRLKTA